MAFRKHGSSRPVELLVHAVRAHAGLQEPAHRVLAHGEGPSMSLGGAGQDPDLHHGLGRRTRRWTSERHVTVAVSSRRPGMKGAAFCAGRGRSR